MTGAWVVLFSVASLVFVEQDAPGLHVGKVNALSGATRVNFRHADIDGDGVRDVLLPGEAILCRKGGQPLGVRMPFPEPGTDRLCDTWGDYLYLLGPETLEVVSWRGDGWERALSQGLSWPHEEAFGGRTAPLHEREARGFRFSRYLHDLDLDGTPEIVVPGEAGIHVYRKEGPGYGKGRVLDVFPTPVPRRACDQALWPPEERAVRFPVLQSRCRLVFGEKALLALVREEAGSGLVSWRMIRYALEWTEEGRIRAEPVSVTETKAMAGHLQPCRLNSDEMTDFAGGDWSFSTAQAFPAPIHEMRATFDGGSTFEARRSRSFRPQAVFVDFDGDGRKDLVGERTGLFDRGPRETVSRFVTGRDVDHEIGVYLQDRENRFSRRAGYRMGFRIRLDKPPARGTEMFRRYLRGELVNITGDIDGDGVKDLVVQDRPDRLAVFLTRDMAAPERPDSTVRIAEGGRFGVADIDGDGRCDIVVQQGLADEDGPGPKTAALFSRRGPE